MPACLCGGKLCENFAEHFSLLNREKHTRNNLISLNLPSVRIEFSKRSVYFWGAKIHNELPVQTRQLGSFEKFRKSINAFFDWDRRDWIIAFLIHCNIDLKTVKRSKMVLNFSLETLCKSFFRWFGSLSVLSQLPLIPFDFCLFFVFIEALHKALV